MSFREPFFQPAVGMILKACLFSCSPFDDRISLPLTRRVRRSSLSIPYSVDRLCAILVRCLFISSKS